MADSAQNATIEKGPDSTPCGQMRPAAIGRLTFDVLGLRRHYEPRRKRVLLARPDALAERVNQ
jgi:hypothetical protein